MVAATGSVGPMPTRSYKWDAQKEALRPITQKSLDAKEAMRAMYATCLGMLLFISKDVYIPIKRAILQVVLNAITQLFALGVCAYYLGYLLISDLMANPSSIQGTFSPRF